MDLADCVIFFRRKGFEDVIVILEANTIFSRILSLTEAEEFVVLAIVWPLFDFYDLLWHL